MYHPLNQNWTHLSGGVLTLWLSWPFREIATICPLEFRLQQSQKTQNKHPWESSSDNSMRFSIDFYHDVSKITICWFPKIGVPQNRPFRMENPIQKWMITRGTLNFQVSSILFSWKILTRNGWWLGVAPYVGPVSNSKSRKTPPSSPQATRPRRPRRPQLRASL